MPAGNMGAVTDLATRPSGRGVESLGPAASPRTPIGVVVVAAGAAAALGGALVIVAVSVLSWLTSTWNLPAAGSAGHAAATGLRIWLAAHHVPIELGDVRISYAPLGLTVLLALVMVVTGGQVVRRVEPRNALELVKAVVGLAGAYGVAAMVIAAFARPPGSIGTPGIALLAGFLLALVTGSVGALRRLPELRIELAAAAPTWVRPIALGALATTAVMVASGLVLVVVELAVHHRRLTSLVDAYHAGWFSVVMLVLVCLLLLPNAALYGAAYLLGPGFSIGGGTLVSPMLVDLGPLPNVPILAALPQPGTPPTALGLVYAVGIAAGVTGLVVAIRGSAAGGDDWRDAPIEVAALRGALTGAGAAVLTSTLVTLAGGSWGSGYLGEVGAPVLATIALSLAAFGLSGAVGAALWWLVGGRRRVRG